MQFRCTGIVRISAGDDAAATRAATGSGQVSVGKTHAVGRQVVDCGRFDVGMPITTDVVIRNIVGDEKDNIRPVVGAQNRREKEKCEKDKSNHET